MAVVPALPRAMHGNLAPMEADLSLGPAPAVAAAASATIMRRAGELLRILAKHLLDGSDPGRQTTCSFAINSASPYVSKLNVACVGSIGCVVAERVQTAAAKPWVNTTRADSSGCHTLGGWGHCYADGARRRWGRLFTVRRFHNWLNLEPDGIFGKDTCYPPTH